MLEEVSDELSCSICLDVLCEPKTLPCLHSFCKTCLEDIVQAGLNKELLCPNCRKPFVVPGNSIDSFPTNFQLISLIERLKLSDNNEQPRVSSISLEKKDDSPQIIEPVRSYIPQQESSSSVTHFPLEWERRAINRNVSFTGQGKISSIIIM